VAIAYGTGEVVGEFSREDSFTAGHKSEVVIARSGHVFYFKNL